MANHAASNNLPSQQSARMERRPMGPQHQPSASLLHFHSGHGFDFDCQNGGNGQAMLDPTAIGHQLMAVKQPKQEMHSPSRQLKEQAQPQQQQNGIAFHPSQLANGGVDSATDSSSLDQLALASHPSMDFFPPVLHQLLLQPECATSAGYFCTAASSFSNSSSTPVDPQPSINGMAPGKAPAPRNGPSNKDRKRPYPCTLCASKFGSKMELEEHQNSHTGQKPFQCDICQSRFNRRSTLWNHKRIHSDAKPFVCTVCHMQFKWKNSLKCHKEMHLRKNELSHGMTGPDVDGHGLTYATAAKKKISELGGGLETAASTPLLPTPNSSSRLLTCAGTPRKRAPPRPTQQKGGKQKSGGQIGQTKPGGNGQKGRERGQKENARNGRTVETTSTSNRPDFFRVQCAGGVVPSSSSSAPANGPVANAQQPFGGQHVDQVRPNASSSYCPELLVDQTGQLQMAQMELLACNGTMAAANFLEQQQQQQQTTLCCSNLLQDFQMAGQNCAMQQGIDAQSMRSLAGGNFLGFDLNSLAVDPNLLLHHPTSSASSAPSSFPSSQFGGGQPFSSSSAQGSVNSSAMLNGYHFDPASMLFLTAPAEQQGTTANGQGGQGQQHQAQQMAANSAALEYGLFSADYGYPVQQQQAHVPHRQQQQQAQRQSDQSGQQQQQQLFSEDGRFHAHLVLEQQQHHHHQQQQQQFMSAALAHEQQQQHMAMGAGDLSLKAQQHQQVKQQQNGAGVISAAISY